MSTEAPRILIAPACFKGSLSAMDAAQCIADFLRDKLAAKFPALSLDICPVADGGDDTLNVLQQGDSGFEWRSATVMGPLPDMQVTARYLAHPAQKLAVVEAAQAHGYQLLKTQGLAPMQATSYGVGQLLGQVIQNEPGLETIVITVGGSASTDGGLGLLQALGVRFLDETGIVIEQPIAGETLSRIRKVGWLRDWSFSGQILIATDVVNPLLGPDGTAAVFAPQKGASPVQVTQLEEGLKQVSRLISDTCCVNYTILPGVGAAGGLAYGLRHLPRAGIISGSQWIADSLRLGSRIADAQLIITGEGRLDATSFAGKATGNILAWAGNQPVLIFCGQVQDGIAFPEQIALFPLALPEENPQAAMGNPMERLQARLTEALPFIEKHLSVG